MKTKIPLLTLACLLPPLVLAQNPLTYTTNNGAITIMGYVGPRLDVTNVVIPATINGHPVASIGSGVFQFCDNLTNLTIGNSVTSIGDGAFNGCTGLTSVMIPDSVTNLGYATFFGCTGLTNVTLGNSVTSIGNAVFYRCTSLTGMTIPVNVVSIGEEAFSNCANLTSVVIHSGVTNIGIWAFKYCASLTNLTVAAENFVYSSVNGVLFNKTQTTLIQFPGGLSGSYTIPGGVTNIGSYAFGRCTGLTNVTIPASVTSIGDRAFNECANLMSIRFFGNAPAFGHAVFSFVPGTVYYYYGTSGWETPYGDLPTVMLYRTWQDTLYIVVGNGTVTIIGYVGDANNVTSVVIPAAIDGCPVTSIGGSAFRNCINLTNVTISDGVTEIGDGAFYNCISLTSVTIPASVAGIGKSAFTLCTNLISVTFLGNAPQISGGMFSGSSGRVYYYYGTTGWDITYGGLPTVMLGAPAPQMGGGNNVGVQSGNFGFTITGVVNQTIVVEASTDLQNWQSVWTNTLTTTSTEFTDSQWRNFPARFYRAR